MGGIPYHASGWSLLNSQMVALRAPLCSIMWPVMSLVSKALPKELSICVPSSGLEPATLEMGRFCETKASREPAFGSSHELS